MEVKVHLVLVRKVEQVDQEEVLLLVQDHHLLQEGQEITHLLVHLKEIMVELEVFYNMVQVLVEVEELVLLDLQVIKIQHLIVIKALVVEEVMEVMVYLMIF